MNGTNQFEAHDNEVTVLVVEDDESFHDILANAVLAGHGYLVLHAYSGGECIEMLAQHSVDVVLLDLNLPDGNGFRVLQDMREQGDRATTIVLSAFLDPQSVHRAMAAGAWTVIDKRFEDYRLLPQLIAQALEERAQKERCAVAGGGERGLELDGGLPAHAPYARHRLRTSEMDAFARLERSGSLIMHRLMQQARAAAERSSPVIIRGEPGSDRELLARYVHARSRRALGAFVASQALPGGGLASTAGGIAADRLLAAAGTGTLFIDQVHLLGQEWQSQLLSVIDRAAETLLASGRVAAPVSMTARLVVASTAAVDDPCWSALDPRLRETWSAAQLVIPPLRERLSDVAGKLEPLLADTAAAMGVPPPRVTPEVVAALMQYPFPGNEQELRAMAMLACARKPGAPLEPHDLVPLVPPHDLMPLVPPHDPGS